MKGWDYRPRRVCSKCREAKTLDQFRSLTHRNRHTGRGKLVHFGWAEQCRDCEAAA